MIQTFVGNISLVNDLSIKLNKANALLFKTRKYVSLKILRSIYNVLLSFLGSELQHYSTNYNFTKKAIRIINFQRKNVHTSPLFKKIPILLFQGKICLENILFISKSLYNLWPLVFNTWFSFSSDQYNYETSSSTQSNLIKPFYKKKYL